MAIPTIDSVRAIVREKRVQVADEAEKAERAEGLARSVQDMKADRARLEKRRDGFAGLGTAKFEATWNHYVPGLGSIEMEPMRSKLTGRELAEATQRNIDDLQASIDSAEAEIEQLLK